MNRYLTFMVHGEQCKITIKKQRTKSRITLRNEGFGIYIGDGIEIGKTYKITLAIEEMPGQT